MPLTPADFDQSFYRLAEGERMRGFLSGSNPRTTVRQRLGGSCPIVNSAGQPPHEGRVVTQPELSGTSNAVACAKCSARARPNHPGDPPPTPRNRCRCASWWVARMSASRYRLVIEGELGPRYASAFEGMTVRAHDGETDIIGPITDSSHLHGLLERIASLGLRLHSLVPLEGEDPGSGGQTHAEPGGVNPDTPGIHRRSPTTSTRPRRPSS